MQEGKYDSMRAKKSSRAKAKVTNVKISKRQAKSIAKKVNSAVFVCVAIFLVLGAGLGYAGVKYLCKDDCFEMANFTGTNSVDVVVDMSALEGDTGVVRAYDEQSAGVRCVAFGKDISSDVKVEYFYRPDEYSEAVQVSAVDCGQSGIYYAKYTIDHIIYRGIVLVRNIFVLGGGV